LCSVKSSGKLYEMITRIEVTPKYPQFPDTEGTGVLSNIHDLGITSVKNVRVVKIFKLEGKFSSPAIHRLTSELLVESIWQDYAINVSVIPEKNVSVIEISRRPGVMDTEIDSILKAISDMGITGVTMVGTGKKYILYGKVSKKNLEIITYKLLVNKTVEHVMKKPEKTLVVGSSRTPTQKVKIRRMTEDELLKLTANRLWLDLSEMKAIQDYFRKGRRDPTDVEIETIAQTWSEHCGHKTFNASLVINGKQKPSLMSRLKEATRKVSRSWCLSVFKDNAGVIVFDKEFAICGKVETHNSPSAIEPYGGAMTGSGGVFRDIAGCGLGAKVIVSTDIFCFAPPDLPEKEVPVGCLHPRRLLKEVVRGVKDYGNRMGIPTNNGSIHFHADWRAKPTVIVGAYGILPRKFVNKKKLKRGDLIITVGGKTGRDGIHGATFSSGSMTDTTESVSSSAVQIGNAIEEKRMFDALLACRDTGLIKYAQDCGGGGYSSAIGEIAEEYGARVQLDQIPVKYPGLASWELWISESQERMIVVIEPRDKKKFIQKCKDYNVAATVLGKITNTKRLELKYDKQIECDLSLDFLHNGCPTTHKLGTYKRKKIPEPSFKEPANYTQLLKKILAHGDICSKEPIVRKYDHEVQGTLAFKPFSGPYRDAPGDASVITPLLGKRRGMAVSHGMIPLYNKIDPYWGSASAIDEAVRNLVAVGVDPEKIALIDNFIWPTPDEVSLGDLDRSVDACVDTASAFGMPFVSGKDSLSSTYVGSDGKIIKIPPTLCISAFAPVLDVYKTVSSYLKSPDNHVFIIGETKQELGGSAYYSLKNNLGNTVPRLNAKKALDAYKKIHRAIAEGAIRSCHDCSEGGMGVSMAEMCFGSYGADIDLLKVPLDGFSSKRADYILFSESNSRFLVEVPAKKKALFKKIMGTATYGEIGWVTPERRLKIRNGKKILIDVSVNELKKAWKEPMQKIFG